MECCHALWSLLLLCGSQGTPVQLHSPAHGMDHGKMPPAQMGLSWMDQRKVGESKCLEWVQHSQPWFAGELPSSCPNLQFSVWVSWAFCTDTLSSLLLSHTVPL